MNNLEKLCNKYRDMYGAFDLGHNKLHHDEVVKFGMDSMLRYNIYASENNEPLLNTDVMRLVLSGHDIGMSVSREDHELHSVEIIRHDPDVHEIFTCSEVDLICLAILEHRTSRQATTVYSQILKDADDACVFNPHRFTFRIVGFNYFYTVSKRTHNNDSEMIADLYAQSVEALKLDKHNPRQFRAECEVNKGFNFSEPYIEDHEFLMNICKEVLDIYR